MLFLIPGDAVFITAPGFAMATGEVFPPTTMFAPASLFIEFVSFCAMSLTEIRASLSKQGPICFGCPNPCLAGTDPSARVSGAPPALDSSARAFSAAAEPLFLNMINTALPGFPR